MAQFGNVLRVTGWYKGTKELRNLKKKQKEILIYSLQVVVYSVSA